MTLDDTIFNLIYAVLVFGVPALVVWASYSEARWLSKFDVSTLWVHQERVDKFAVIILGTWWVHTSSMLLWAFLKTVQTQDYVTYMGWALPIIAKMFAPRPEDK